MIHELKSNNVCNKHNFWVSSGREVAARSTDLAKTLIFSSKKSTE